MNFEKMSKEEFIQTLRKDYFYETNSPYTLEQRVAFIEQLMVYLKLTKNREQIAYLICNRPRVLTEACAGAGKTTISILRSVTMNMFGDTDAEHTLMLTYTKEASKDLTRKLAQLGSRLSKVNFGELNLNFNIRIMTLHSFFHELIYEYNDMLGIKMIDGGEEGRNRLKLLTGSSVTYTMQDVLTTMVNHGYKDIKMYNSLPRQMHSLYTQIKEKDVYEQQDEWIKCSSFKEVSSIPVVTIAKAFSIYEKIKKSNQTVELCEFANKAYLLLQNPIILERWRKMYTNYFVDEFQDVTEAQSKCLRQLVNGATGLHFAAIGDGDQSIYGFRGAHSNGCYNFPKEYSTGDLKDMAVCYMSLNRRCPEQVLNNSKLIIETLNVRNPKDLYTDKPGGKFELLKVDSYQKEAEQVYKTLKGMKLEDLADTVIAYRSKRSSRYIKDYLHSRGIRCKFNEYIEDLFESTLEKCYMLLDNPVNMSQAKAHLFKMLPKSSTFNKEVISKILDEEVQSRKSFNTPKEFYAIDWSAGAIKYGASMPENFLSEMDMLRRISRCVSGDVQEATLKNPNVLYMDYLTPLLLYNHIKKYYLNWQDKQMSTDGAESIFDGKGDIYDEYCRRVFKRYTAHTTYREFRQEQIRIQETLENSQRYVNLSTFHSLKGLEFTNVFLIDMRDNVFPGYELMLASEFGADFIKQADDEAKRLLYVAMTRSKQNLYILSREVNPFRYESYLIEQRESNSISSFDIGSFSTAEFEEFTATSGQEDLTPWDETPVAVVEEVVEESEEGGSSLFNRASAFSRWMNE